VKSPRRLAVLAALCGTVVLVGWVAAGLTGLGSPGTESTGAPIEVSRATSATARAEHVDAPQARAPSKDGAGSASALSAPRPMPRPTTPSVRTASLSTPDPVRSEAKGSAGPVEVAAMGSSSAALSDPPMPRPATTPTLFAAVSPTDPVQNAAKPAVSSEALDACEPDVCIDQYLWSLYERTPKVDALFDPA
jgi:hypothetical protein